MEAVLKLDPELDAMAKVLQALTPLEDDARRRVLGWMQNRYGFQEAAASASIDRTKRIDEQTATVVGRPEGTINTVSFKLKVESCRDLLVAAAAYLTIYVGKERFTKVDLVTAAKESQAWKVDYTNQTSVNIKRMQAAQELFEKAKDVFALSPTKLKELEAALAE